VALPLRSFYGSTAIWQWENFTLAAIEKVENNKYMAGGSCELWL
jgi:hypothetical protein